MEDKTAADYHGMEGFSYGRGYLADDLTHLRRHYAANAPSELSLIAVHHRKFVELADCVSRALASGYRATDLCLPLLNVPPKFSEMRLANVNMRDGIDVMRKGSPHACKTPQDLVRSTWPTNFCFCTCEGRLSRWIWSHRRR